MKKKDQMYDILLQCSEAKKLVSVFSDPHNTDKFAAGFALQLSNSHLLLGDIDPYGRYDGFSVWALDSIYMLEVDTLYHQKLSLLYQLQSSERHEVVFDSDDLLAELLNMARNQKHIVTIELCDSDLDDVQGFVASVREDVVSIHMVTRFGAPNGTCYLKKSDITHIRCHSSEEAAMKLLYEHCM